MRGWGWVVCGVFMLRPLSLTCVTVINRFYYSFFSSVRVGMCSRADPDVHLPSRPPPPVLVSQWSALPVAQCCLCVSEHTFII